MCMEVDDIACQETLRYAESQLQAVGSKVKQFCIELIEELSPTGPPPTDPVEDLNSNQVQNAGVAAYEDSLLSLFLGNKFLDGFQLQDIVVFVLVFLQEASAGRYYHNVTGLSSRKHVGGCNLFQVQWVFDPTYPFYDSFGCPFIDAEFDYLKYGRPDKQYLNKYSWKPDGCSLPRFDGASFLAKWRGKKIMFVGDSLSLDMYMESVGDVLDLGSINGGNAWEGMDVLIFNSWHWLSARGLQHGATGLTALLILPRPRDREWNQPKKKCYRELEPLSGPTYPAGAPPAAAIVNKVLGMKKPVF
ncbi:3R-hydroxymyristoyl- dehydratase-hydroxymyristoyl ACP dehydrase isoform 1 [Hibiscus syriacus]|uniref:3R-hydroxymyristoyl-dehydratase-hydroxymyristoyl ACP dehydrase isoform 1 n=1 Tax=Hibiscus syriacus TaxID=106335 RepID=A0A6A3BSK6_HIBSY|nr:3R-hydroxymyristoyl- dehydratase-hydroxymyristoyl ACP dehydrase isoform 1 [Hibiscus syriacus]